MAIPFPSNQVQGLTRTGGRMLECSEERKTPLFLACWTGEGGEGRDAEVEERRLQTPVPPPSSYLPPLPPGHTWRTADEKHLGNLEYSVTWGFCSTATWDPRRQSLPTPPLGQPHQSQAGGAVWRERWTSCCFGVLGLLLGLPWCGFNTEETETLGSSISEQDCFDSVADEGESPAFHISRSKRRPHERGVHQLQSELQEPGSQVIPPAMKSLNPHLPYTPRSHTEIEQGRK